MSKFEILKLMAFASLFAVMTFILVVVFVGNRRAAKYDERQELIRGRGDRYSFLVLIVGEVISALFMQTDFYTKHGIAVNFAIIMLSLTVMSVYDIVHGAYFAFNEEHVKANSWLYVVLGICLILGYIDDFNSALNIMGIYWLIIGAVSLFQLHRDKESDKD